MRVTFLAVLLFGSGCASAEPSATRGGDAASGSPEAGGRDVKADGPLDASLAGDAKTLGDAKTCVSGSESRVCNRCGVQERTCQSGAWSTWDTCRTPPCCATDIEARECGLCGNETRRCDVDRWGAWSACVEGACCKDNLSGTATVDGPAGMMVQSHTANDLCDLERALDHICKAHQSGSSEIKDLVLTDAVKTGPSGLTEDLNTDVLDLVLRYAHCIDNLFIGTMPEVLLSDPYAESTLADSSKRWQWLGAAKRVADKVQSYLAANAPTQPWYWYVSYEANLNAFTSASYRGYYEALLIQHTTDLKATHASNAVLWSPTFWSDPDTLGAGAKTTLSSSLSTFFANVPAISWVVVQDHLGVQPSWTCDDALEYYDIVRASGTGLASVQLNVEYFTTAGGIQAGSPSELASRIGCYRSAGASLGASFDYRYWYRTHGH